MATLVKILRTTAKLLLVLTPLMAFSGLVTAKPFLLSGDAFRWARLLHTAVVPVAFFPLLAVHSWCGLLFMLSRNKRWNVPWVKRLVTLGWGGVFLVGGAVSFVPVPTRAVSVPGSLSAAPATDPAPSATGLQADSEQPDAALPVKEAGAGVAREARDAAVGQKRRSDLDAGPSPLGGAPPSRSRRHQQRASASPTQRTPVAPVIPLAEEMRAAPPTPAPQNTAPPQPGAELVRQRCGACHGLDVVYGTRRSAAEWQQVLTRMIQMGANLNEHERQAVLRHLVNLPGSES